MERAENLLSEWSALLLTSFADAGIRDVVVSPGSRSTPFVAAAIREPRLRLHDVIDERSAAFFALGQARASGLPSLLLCTSGTAGAHYLPAIIEAGLAGVPLVILTADRPSEAMDCGAPQTIDQTKLYGDHVRRFFDLGMPDEAIGALRAVRRTAFQACLATRYPSGGAVHVNARARKPLEPTTVATSDAAKALAAAARAVRAQPIHVAPPVFAPDASVLDDVARRIGEAERGLIVCGPASTALASAREAIFDLARRSGFPLLAEGASQLRLGPVPPGVVVCDGFDAVLRAPAFRRAAPDLILQVGGVPISTGWERYVDAHATVARVVFADHGWPDPTGTATAIVLGPVPQNLAALALRVPARANMREWSARFEAAAEIAARAADDVLARAHDLREGTCARVVVERLPPGSGLMLGNSLPIRMVDAFARRGASDVLVFSQRGANGIDGLVAGAAGAASIHDGPFTLVLGDVSLLHDIGSLALARRATTPLVIVVVQNHGGRIFEQLPLGGSPPLTDVVTTQLYADTLAHACTLHEQDFAHAAAFYGLRYEVVALTAQLTHTLDAAYAHEGATLIEVRVPDSGAADDCRHLWRAVEVALGL